ncbi:MAG TPA: inorganic phosphate transporter [Tenuifilaceae bacterium]|nr:inorganic phosphate transporter [Tenuifilaceae bacterium]
MFLLFISSGLFLGWSLGANDAANIFGTAVGSKMLSFKKAAIIASIFIILGAVIQGSGTTETLSKLGTVDAIGGAFTVALCAAFTVFIMTRNKLPVSTTQSIVGAIIGWNLFTNNKTDYSILTTILTSWVAGPIIGIVFAALLFLLTRWLLHKLKIHLIKLDGYIRWGLIIVGAFGAYSLGANNIANVVGVFMSSAPNLIIDLGLFQLNGAQLIFLLGGVSIAIGVFTYGSKVMETVGSQIMNLSSEAAMVVVLAQALVLFIFSSTGLSNFLETVGLPRIPLVPISSSQIVVGAIIGIGLVKGVQEIKVKTLGGIFLGWILTPIAACILSFFALFFVKNVFNITVTSAVASIPATPVDASSMVATSAMKHVNMVWPFTLMVIVVVVALFVFYIIKQQKLRVKAQDELYKKQNDFYIAQKALTELELKTIRLENSSLASKLEFKRKELINYALNIIEQQNFMASILDKLIEIKNINKDSEREEMLDGLIVLIKQKMANSDKVKNFNIEAEKMHKDFYQRLSDQFPDLTENDKRLATLLRLGFSSKEIAPLLNISPKSVEIIRYRLRKKINLKKGDNLIQFINNL